MNMKHPSSIPAPAYERKGFSSALDCFLEQNCPSLRGKLIREPVVKEISKLVDQYFPPLQNMRMGQMLWYAVAIEERGKCGKRIEDCKLKPVIVDVIHETDIEDLLNGIARRERQKKVAVRIFKQAYDQGGVMSLADVGAIMRLTGSSISIYVREYERATGTMVPRRGNIHDLGPTLTHKKIICQKHLKEGKTIEQTARETYHSPESVRRYVNDFQRVRECLKAGWTVEKTAYTTGLSPRLANEYFELMANELPF